MRLFLPQLHRLHLLRGMIVSHHRLRALAPPAIQALRQNGVRYLAAISEEIRHRRGGRNFFLDSRIVVSDDWGEEILVHASRLRAQILLLGSPRGRPLARIIRFWQGDTLERVLAETPCDVGIYRT